MKRTVVGVRVAATVATAVDSVAMGSREDAEEPKVLAVDLAACCFQRALYIRRSRCEQKGRGEHSEAGFEGFTVSVGCKRTV